MRVVQARAIHRIGGEKLRRAARRADRVHSRLPAFGIAPEHGDFCASRCETICQRASEHTRGSDDDCDFTREIKKRGIHVRREKPTPPRGATAKARALRWHA